MGGGRRLMSPAAAHRALLYVTTLTTVLLVLVVYQLATRQAALRDVEVYGCQQLEAFKGSLATIVRRSGQTVASQPYYRRHPEEIARVRAQNEIILRVLAPLSCDPPRGIGADPPPAAILEWVLYGTQHEAPATP